jgi:cellobiose phosphorylase
MLGVRPEVNGLRIDPCLPGAWTKAEMTRDYRGATYRIAIRKRRGLCKGKVRLTLDGRPLAGSLIPPQNDGQTHEVRVWVE